MSHVNTASSSRTSLCSAASASSDRARAFDSPPRPTRKHTTVDRPTDSHCIHEARMAARLWLCAGADCTPTSSWACSRPAPPASSEQVAPAVRFAGGVPAVEGSGEPGHAASASAVRDMATERVDDEAETPTRRVVVGRVVPIPPGQGKSERQERLLADAPPQEAVKRVAPCHIFNPPPRHLVLHGRLRLPPGSVGRLRLPGGSADTGSGGGHRPAPAEFLLQLQPKQAMQPALRI
eukprot:scaffold15150_cov75-Phaeocystis_antarctica.AAC.1